MDESTTRRGTDTPVHRPEKPAGSTLSSTSGLSLRSGLDPTDKRASCALPTDPVIPELHSVALESSLTAKRWGPASPSPGRQHERHGLLPTPQLPSILKTS